MRCYPFRAASNATRFLLNHKLYQDVEIIIVYIHNEITFTERLSSERNPSLCHFFLHALSLSLSLSLSLLYHKISLILPRPVPNKKIL